MRQLAQEAYIRVNQAGYLPADRKVAIAFSREPIADTTFLMRQGTSVVFTGRVKEVPSPNWGGTFEYFYELDFSAKQYEGRYTIQLVKAKARSHEFSIGAYPGYQEDLLFFMRQQRCGYNPYLDAVCHHARRPFFLRAFCRTGRSSMQAAAGTTPAIS